jgi:hypothetical protein
MECLLQMGRSKQVLPKILTTHKADAFDRKNGLQQFLQKIFIFSLQCFPLDFVKFPLDSAMWLPDSTRFPLDNC